jgi:peptidoglycan/xylan/chitin deacetylase (PgdA/CDA1 family)
MNSLQKEPLLRMVTSLELYEEERNQGVFSATVSLPDHEIGCHSFNSRTMVLLCRLHIQNAIRQRADEILDAVGLHPQEPSNLRQYTASSIRMFSFLYL